MGARKPQPEISSTFSEAKTLIKNLHRPHKPQDGYYGLTREQQVIIFRLRTGHNRLNQHMHKRLKLTPSPICPCGAEEQNTEHVLQRCSQYEMLRKSIWPVEIPMREKIYGPQEELMKTTRFIIESGLQV